MDSLSGQLGGLENRIASAVNTTASASTDYHPIVHPGQDLDKLALCVRLKGTLPVLIVLAARIVKIGSASPGYKTAMFESPVRNSWSFPDEWNVFLDTQGESIRRTGLFAKP